jgi:hypothetical protein
MHQSLFVVPKTGESIPTIGAFANSNEACNNFAKKVFLHPNSQRKLLTYYPPSQDFMSFQLQVLHKSF